MKLCQNDFGQNEQNFRKGIMRGEYDLAGKVIGMAMKIHSTLGTGFLESVCHNALAHELKMAGMRFESEKQLNVFYDMTLVGEFMADAELLVNFGGERLEFKKKFRMPKLKSAETEVYSDHSVHSVKE
jgi:PD-(D/E)XK nuclease superfamily